MNMSLKPNQIKPYQTKQIKPNQTKPNQTKPNLTLPYCTAHGAGSHKAQGATQYKEPYRPSPDMSDLGPLLGDGPRPIVEYSHNNSKGKLQGDTSPNRVWIVLTLPYCTGSHTVQGPTEHREPPRHCQVKALQAITKKRLTFGPIWRWLQAALITCLSSDELAFAYCKYNIKNGMAPLHSYRNGELIPFLQEWNASIPFLQEWSDHFIPIGMESSFHSYRNGMTPFHSYRNGVSTPFLQE